ncbi:hypothetical protein ACW185_09580 [Limosilactobacillus fermentum]
MIKSSLVQVLQQLRLNEELTVLWLDEKEHPLNIKELKPLGELTVVKEGEQLIAARFADQDPLSYQNLPARIPPATGLFVPLCGVSN